MFIEHLKLHLGLLVNEITLSVTSAQESVYGRLTRKKEPLADGISPAGLPGDSSPSRSGAADSLIFLSDASSLFSNRSLPQSSRHLSIHFSSHSSRTGQRGMIVTLTVVMLLSIGLLLLLGPFEMARATWLLSQSS